MDTTTKIFIKTSKGLFGPYPSKTIAEQQIINKTIPLTLNETPEIVERLANGSQMLFE